MKKRANQEQLTKRGETASKYAGGNMQFKEKAMWSLAIREHDSVESRSFLIGLGNGIWMSAILALALYWLLQGVL